MEPVPSPTSNLNRSRQLDLALVLFITLTPLVLASLYYMLGGEPPSDPLRQQFRHLNALVIELCALLVLWHVLFRQGRRWRDIGWRFEGSDIVTGFGLFLWVTVADYAVHYAVEYSYRSITGTFYHPKPLQLGLGVSVASVALLCMNPFFEELIVRAYAMTELLDLSGRQWLAVLVSLIAQMSYHLYQGWFRSILLTVGFFFFSIYFLKTRRIMPVIVAHLCSDLSILLHAGH